MIKTVSQILALPFSPFGSGLGIVVFMTAIYIYNLHVQMIWAKKGKEKVPILWTQKAFFFLFFFYENEPRPEKKLL